MPEPASSSYDEMPYINRPFMQTHPGRLAALAKLFGMRPPAVDSCRVLELGCASGDNLISMAVAMPDARFLGIDLSARQIEQGRQTIAALGLTNIELRHADIAAVDASYGQFDYIVSHGIYSWVPAPIREKLLSICRENLVPDGIAYVSYNTLPGWGIRGMLREVMVYHSRHAAGAAERVRQSRAMLDFLARGLPPDTPHGALLRQDVEVLSQVPDAYLIHDHLEEVNEPIYFHQFVEAAQRHDMQYLAEADFSTMTPANLPPQVAAGLRHIAPDIVALEQYLDFLHNRAFRQTLLVHQGVTLNRNLNAHSVQAFQIASPVRPVSQTPSLTQGANESFRAPNGATFNTVSTITKAALLLLMRQWPAALPFTQLVAAARASLQENTGAVADGSTLARDTKFLGSEMLQSYAAGVVEFRVWSPLLSVTASARPTASPLARLQAARSDEVTNLHQQRVTLNGISRVLLPLLDGSRDRDALVAVLVRLAAEGSLNVQQQGKALTHGPALEKVLRDALEENLPRLAKAALLLD
jgi:methyltransferase-like protein/SAM-dependent methyltransferase